MTKNTMTKKVHENLKCIFCYKFGRLCKAPKNGKCIQFLLTIQKKQTIMKPEKPRRSHSNIAQPAKAAGHRTVTTTKKRREHL